MPMSVVKWFSDFLSLSRVCALRVSTSVLLISGDQTHHRYGTHRIPTVYVFQLRDH